MVSKRHIEKNGLSFDCPDYYDIGNYPSSDKAHKSMVALSKHNRECEIYVTVYRKNAFDSNAKRNMNLLERYLQMLNYKNISIDRRLPYCFNATVNHAMGNIKTTIVYNFDHDDVVMIVGNLKPNSRYDCIDDIRMILDTLRLENFIERAKKKITPKNKTILGLISILWTFLFIPFIPYSFYLEICWSYMPCVVPAIFLIAPFEKIKNSKVLSIISLLIIFPLLILNLGDLSLAISIMPVPNSAFLIGDLPYIIWICAYCLFNLFCAIILYVPAGLNNANSSNICKKCGCHLNNGEKYCFKCGEKIELADSSFKHELLFWYDEKYGYRISKTKLLSIIAFISGVLLGVVSNTDRLFNNLITSMGTIVSCILIGLIFAIPTFVIGYIFHYLLNRKNANNS